MEDEAFDALEALAGATDVQSEQTADDRLEKLLQDLEDGNQLEQFNHGDADLLLRAWDDERQRTRVKDVIQTVRGNRVPPSGGIFFVIKHQALIEGEAAPEEWLPFDQSGCASLNWRKKRGSQDSGERM